MRDQVLRAPQAASIPHCEQPGQILHMQKMPRQLEARGIYSLFYADFSEDTKG